MALFRTDDFHRINFGFGQNDNATPTKVTAVSVMNETLIPVRKDAINSVSDP